jgi:limonene-1,2-epoxide hydrolase
VVEPENEREKLSIPEKEFMVIGLLAFFDTEDDKNINWEDYFGLILDFPFPAGADL